MTTATINENIYGSEYHVAVSTYTKRVIYRCKNKQCKHTYAYEYRRVYSTMGETIQIGNRMPVRYPARFDLHRYVAGKRYTINEDSTCPECGQHATYSEVKGTVNDHVCDARCMGAKNGDCECACGGINHGINYVAI